MNSKDEEIIIKYFKNERIKNIGVTLKVLKQILRKYHIPERIPINNESSDGMRKYRKIKIKESMKKYNAIDAINKDGYIYLKVFCVKCERYKFISASMIRSANINNKEYCCNDCRKNNLNIINAKSKKAKNNKSGYIGVSILNNSRYVGFSCSVMHNGSIILRNIYRDEYHTQKTLIQAAVDRDLFIIEKGLPHTRNFTDDELLSNMEYLAYDNIDTIKKILTE